MTDESTILRKDLREEFSQPSSLASVVSGMQGTQPQHELGKCSTFVQPWERERE